jgi:hypothetical protein
MEKPTRLLFGPWNIVKIQLTTEYLPETIDPQEISVPVSEESGAMIRKSCRDATVYNKRPLSGAPEGGQSLRA